jgi:predicted nucleic acid-binding protein
MRAILDTNVFVSGEFFGGPPHRILQGWCDGRVKLVLSPEILAERRAIERCAAV